MRSLLLFLAFLAFAECRPALAADTWFIGSLPASGVATAPPGGTCGLGYTITNSSTTNWLLADLITSETEFTDGVILPERMVFVSVGPSQTVRLPYIRNSRNVNLLEWQWDAGAKPFKIISGTLDVNAFWFDRDPLKDPAAKKLGNALDQAVPFKLIVSDGMLPGDIAVDGELPTGNGKVNVTVTLDGSVTGTGVDIALQSSSPSVSVPSLVRVTQGRSVSFQVSISEVSVDTPVTLTATREGVTASTQILLRPAVLLKALSVTPSTVVGGETVAGLITLTRPVLASAGALVQLSSSAGTTVPSSVKVPQNTSQATFEIRTSATTNPVAATITAVFGGISTEATLQIQPVPKLSGFSLTPTSVYGGDTSQATLTLVHPAPTAIPVRLSASSAVNIPATVIIPAGERTGTFTVQTKPVTKSAVVTLTATLNGSSQSASLSISKAIKLSKLAVEPRKLKGGSTCKGTITLSGATTGTGINVAVGVSGSEATAPQSVLVPAGSKSATFNIATRAITRTKKITITVSLGSDSKSATVTLTP